MLKRFVSIDDLEDLARGTDEYYTIMGIIGNPLAEKINIIQCKDCVYYGADKDKYAQWCTYIKEYVPLDWFCAGGVSRNG